MTVDAFTHPKADEWLDETLTIPAVGRTLFDCLDRTISLRETLEKLRTSDHKVVGFYLNDLGRFFAKEADWWKRSRAYGTQLNDVVAAIIADAWIYFSWLRSEVDEAHAKLYFRFFSAILDHPDLWEICNPLWLYHYDQPDSNFYDVLPTPFDFSFSEEREKEIWGVSKRHSAEGLVRNARRANDSWEFLRKIFVAPKESRKQVLSEGFEFINYATIQQDTLFFETLGKVLAIELEQSEPLPLDEFRKSPQKAKGKEASPRSVVRRLWVSRGLFLIPNDQLADTPFSMSSGSRKAVCQPRYGRSGKKENLNADSLIKADIPWFDLSKHDDRQPKERVLPLTEKGKEALPKFAKFGLPWKVVSADLK